MEKKSEKIEKKIVAKVKYKELLAATTAEYKFQKF